MNDQQGSGWQNGGYDPAEPTTQAYGHQPYGQNGYGEPYQSAPQGYSSQFPGAHEEPPTQGYVSTEPYGYAHGAAPMPKPPRRSSGRGWIIGAVLLLTAVASFALVTLLMQKKSSNHDAMAPASTVATAPSAAATGSSSRASNSSSASPADFPAGTSDQCTAPLNGDPNDYVPTDNPDVENVRMNENGKTSCAFLRVMRTEVLAHHVEHPDETSFSLSPYSPAKKKPIPMTCVVEGSFTHCKGGEQAELWVRNP